MEAAAPKRSVGLKPNLRLRGPVAPEKPGIGIKGRALSERQLKPQLGIEGKVLSARVRMARSLERGESVAAGGEIEPQGHRPTLSGGTRRAEVREGQEPAGLVVQRASAEECRQLGRGEAGADREQGEDEQQFDERESPERRPINERRMYR